MKFIRRVGKLLLYVLAILLTLFAIVAITIQYPSVQTSLTEKATKLLSEQLKTDVHVGGVDIDFFKTAVLQDIYIGDRQNDTLLFAERLAVDIGVLDLFQSEIFLNKIKLENAYVNLYKAEADSAFNYQFIIDNFSSTTPTDSSSTAPWTFGLGKVILENVRFGMRDEGSGRFDLQTQISEWTISADELDFEKQAIALERLDLSNSTIVFRQLQKDTTAILKKEEKAPLTFPGIGWTITVDKIRLQNNHVAFLDDNASVLENALDYSHLDLQNLNLSLDDFQYADEGILLEINEASFADRSGFVLEKMEGKVAILPNRIAIEDFLFKTPNSDFENDTELVFSVFDDLSDFINKVKLESQFAESKLAVSDLLMIAPQLDKVPNLNFPKNEILNFQGKITLQEDQLHLQNFSFSVGEATKLQANGHIAQLTTALTMTYPSKN
ncbi:MAG: AsmA family protein [Saprospiraceae bacterium]